MKKRHSDAASEYKRIKKEMEDFSNNKESKLKSLKSSIAKEKKAISDAGPTISNIQLEIDLLKDEIAQCEIEMKTLKELKDISVANMALLSEEKKHLEDGINVAKLESEKAEKDLKIEKKTIASYDKEIAKIENEKKTKKQELENSKLEAQQLGHDRQNLVNDVDLASRQIGALLRDNPWIPDHKHNFGKKDSEYYFSGQNMETCQKRMHQMESSHAKLSKSLDSDVMEKYDRYF
jgi:structural maintenance of chromosome 2